MLAKQLLHLPLMFAVAIAANAEPPPTTIHPGGTPEGSNRTFADDIAFLRKHTQVILLEDDEGKARIALAPAWQGRVMTSTAGHERGRSFGWINRDLIASGRPAPHINAFGGEDRLWLGPEGGQFSIFFAKGTPFDLEHWFVPPALDTHPFRTVSQSRTQVSFQSEFSLTNYSGTRFQVTVKRDVRLLDNKTAWQRLRIPPKKDISLVGYESRNTLSNAGKDAWKKDTGLLSIWILGMFAPSTSTTIVVPIKHGLESQLGPRVTSDYFGAIPAERLSVTEDAVFLRGDGLFRSKIGINPSRSLGKLGSYDSEHGVLTIVQFSQAEGVTDYVNSLWKHQDNPYAGDAANSYNDGPATPGAKALGPFFELESSSPAADLARRESLEHTHRTFHLIGPEGALDEVSRATLGVSIAQIRKALDPH